MAASGGIAAGGASAAGIIEAGGLVMNEWHMFGSREGGIYYEITDDGFEKITEWVYDSMDNTYTIDDKNVTKDAVDSLAAEMKTTILVCESEP